MAERLFRQIGYQKTMVSDIAKELRMNPANVYRFFESKKAIHRVVAQGLANNMAAFSNRLTPRLKSNDEKNHGAVEVRIAMVFDAPESGLYR